MWVWKEIIRRAVWPDSHEEQSTWWSGDSQRDYTAAGLWGCPSLVSCEQQTYTKDEQSVNKFVLKYLKFILWDLQNSLELGGGFYVPMKK